ncbi:hypothetical protein D7B24_004795 [Verticillium nonalfalfae]|uniref:Citrate transporter-like domain-containing protein n=1 Tax=Verticillium nonalfalfae TaxID=1051616 RepID=A0A3M9YCS0_9PEZI|nr:uncharacterized protein D7B24_004795 [Verticillium nonalfalfae]RNJ58343.1 hypothetical protein D7B24_004795 [Verticillium nonalfalfae]
MNFVTAPIIADLFLLAIGAIGGKEIRQGILGANNISPLDIMLFFITLAYIAISIDASGLIRFLAFKVLQWGGNNGRRLYLYLYVFFFGLTTFIGNDPVILSGTAFLAYMTRVSKDLSSPRAWIFSQFAAANIGSAILVSSNPTNLVLAGAFGIKFIHYTANMAVPTVITAIVLYPILLYLVFTEPGLIPRRMAMYQLPSHLSNVPPANPNIPAAKDLTVTELSHCTPREAGQIASAQEGESSRDLLALEEVLNPFLDTKSAIVGSVIMATTLITLLALNAASTGTGEHPVFWVTLPAAFLMFCWDVGCGWESRHTTREIAKFGDKKRLQALAVQQTNPALTITTPSEPVGRQATMNPSDEKESQPAVADGQLVTNPESIISTIHEATQCPARAKEQGACDPERETPGNAPHFSHAEPSPASRDTFGSEDFKADNMDTECHKRPQTLVGSCRELVDWLRATFPATMAVFSHLPLALIPFAFAMFVLVQALVSKHWVATFAYGWKHWVDKTGVVGGIGGMGFLSVVLCNFAGTNIGTTILLSRVIQTWEEIHRVSGSQIDSRTFWATVYSMAIGVNYGAFSAAFSASLAGLLWRDILARKEIEVCP